MNGPAQRTTRRESRDLASKFRTAKMVPVMCQAFLPGEGGMLRQSVSFEADRIMGRLISEAYAKVISVYVPVEAVHKAAYSADATADITEVIRRKLMNGAVIFPMAAAETQLSQRMGIVPHRIANAVSYSQGPVIAHNVAVNYLRKRKYIYAATVHYLNSAVTPAILDATVLERYTGVLDPDDHINGNVELALSTTQAPVTGIGILSNDGLPVNRSRRETKGTVGTGLAFQVRSNSDGALQNAATISIAAQANNATSLPAIYADLSAVMADGFSLTDLWQAQKADDLVRQMRAIADSNPTYGEEMVVRWAFGLSIDGQTEPFVLFEREVGLGDQFRQATDATGIVDETRATDLGALIDFAVPVPRTELGGYVITFAQVRPDEVVAQQPHPILTQDWGLPSQAAEMMKIDPEPVIYRNLFADTTSAAQETERKFYAGHNALKRHYVNYGFTRNTDAASVHNKTTLWQYAIPAGVTPDNILYPDNFPQYPWADQNAEVITCRIASAAVIDTPMFFGPDPVETVSVVDTKNLLGA